jgi:hypothetical protein
VCRRNITAAHYKGGHHPGNDLGLHYTALLPIVASCPYSDQLLVTRKFWSPGAASAASQILYDVCKHKGKVSVRDVWQDYIVEEHQKDWRALTTRAYNYFKHARDDPFTELERFDPRSNEWLLFNACVDYFTTYPGTETPFEISAYFTWFLAVHPRMIRKGHPLTAVILSESSFNELSEKSPDQQRQWAADMLRTSYTHLNKRPPVTGLSDDFCDNGLVLPGGVITEY